MTADTVAATQTAYHGSALHRLSKLLQALRSGTVHHLYVTDTPERAARYANAQATRTVDPAATTVGEHAAVVAVTIPADTRWLRRSDQHASLDTAEAYVTSLQLARVVAVQTCSYHNCRTCNDWRASEQDS